MALILASASPRRRELLALITPDFTVRTAPVDESAFTEPTPAALAGRLAYEKCRAAAALWPGDCVLGADTVVDAGGQVLGKPRDTGDARRMLRLLSGRRHLVHTGVCVACGGGFYRRTVTSAVEFAPLTDAEIERYIATDEPYDKAGAYGIQGGAAIFVRRIEGCYYNIMGLPVRDVYELLSACGGLPLR